MNEGDVQKPKIAEGVTIVIPAYNEEKGISRVLNELSLLLNEISEDVEVIVVDDGSVDETASRASAFDWVRVIRQGGNRGYGASLKTGVRHARYDVVCITDADGTYPNSRIPELLSTLRNSSTDMAVGARIGSNVAIPLVRRPAKWLLGQLAQFVAGTAIPDLNSGLRCFYRQDALRFFSMLPDGFSFTTTITLALLTNGYTIIYLPIDYHARVGRSKIRPIRDTLNFVQLVMRIALYFAPLRIFGPVAALMIILAIGFAIFSKVVLGELPDVSTLVLALTGVQIGALGLLAELINRRLPNYFRD